jgi:hypothetical protein
MWNCPGNMYSKYSGFRLIGPPVNWGSRLFGANPREKTNWEYNQNLLRLFGAPCRLIGPVTATWHACDIILEMHHVGNYEEFFIHRQAFNVITKMKIVKMQLLNKLQRNTRRHQNTRKPMRMTQLSVNECD